MGEDLTENGGYQQGHLSAKPLFHAALPPGLPGEYRPDATAGWEGVLYVPDTYRPGTPAPLMLSLHGAGSKGERMLTRWRSVADRAGTIVLAPDSVAQTWDVLVGGYGRDVARLDLALAYTFERYNVHRAPLLIEGFSDGASYGLSLGLANGQLFTHVLANSPGFCMPPAIVGTPRLLLTHGTQDQVLPVDRTSRLLAPQLERAGYDITCVEFDGPHVLTEAIMVRSLEWAGIRVAPSLSPD